MSEFKADSILTDQIQFNPVTEAERNALTNVPESMIVYNSDSNRIEMYTGGSWNPVPVNSDVDTAIQNNGGNIAFQAPTTGAGGAIFPLAIGGISNDQSGLDKLDGLAFQDIIQNMFFPVLEPTFTNPTTDFTISPSIGIIGDTVSVSLTASFSRGTINASWSPYLDDTGAAAPTQYAGIATNYEFSVNGNLEQSSSSDAFTEPAYTIDINNNSFELVTTYAEGNQAYNSFGAAFGTPLQSGTVAITKSITATYPVYTNSDSQTTLDTQLPLVSLSTTQLQFDISFTENPNKHAFQIPDMMGTVSKIEAYNSFSGGWETLYQTGDQNPTWSSSSVAVQLFGFGVPYTRWDHTGTNAGPRTFRVTTS